MSDTKGKPSDSVDPIEEDNDDDFDIYRVALQVLAIVDESAKREGNSSLSSDLKPSTENDAVAQFFDQLNRRLDAVPAVSDLPSTKPLAPDSSPPAPDLIVATPTDGMTVPPAAPASGADADGKETQVVSKEAPTEVKEKKPEVSEAIAGKLSAVPNSELTKEALLRLLPDINSMITRENVQAKLKDSGAVDRPKIDAAKLSEEWAKGEFGAESRKLWREAQKLIEQQSVAVMRELDSRGIPFPPGAPLGPGMSASGTNLRETDELFRAKLRTGEAQLKFGFENLKPGEIPTKEQVEGVVNSVIFMGRAHQQLAKVYLEGQATAVQFNIDSTNDLFYPGVAKGWKRPENVPPDQLERWSAGASEWLGTANRVRFYAEAIATLNSATTTRGMDFPSVTKALEVLFGVGNDKKVFPDDALKNFPGEVKRDENGRIVSIKLDLPDSVDRSEANLAKMAKLEKWLSDNKPQVDRVFKELVEVMANSDRMLLWAEQTDIETTKNVSGAELLKLKEKHPNAEVNKRVTLENGNTDYCIKEIKKDGSWVLEARAPNDKPFNLKRYGFEVINCDKEGNQKDDGTFRKVRGYQDYLYAEAWSYNNWNINPLDALPGGHVLHGATGDKLDGVKKVDRKYTKDSVEDGKPVVYSQDDFIPIADNGRLRLMQVKNLNAWANAAEFGKQTGNVANLAIDVGMLASGTLEFKAALAAGEFATKEFFKQALKAFWHLGLGATGFGKQFILNNVPYGQELMHARHMAILADLSLQLLPSSTQTALWAKIWGESKGVGLTEQWMTGVTKAGKSAPWFDRALMNVHHAYEGTPVTSLSWVPKAGIFPFCDCYFIAQFGDVVRATRPGEEDQRERLGDASARYGRERVGRAQKPEMAGQPPLEEMRKLTQAVLSDYSNLFSPDRSSETPAGKRLEAAVKEAKALPQNDPKRTALYQSLVTTFRDEKASAAERLASAKGLLELSKNAEGVVPAQIPMGAANWTSSILEKFIDRHPHTVAAKTAEIAKLPADSPERIAYRNNLAETFYSVFESDQRHAAAMALMRLSVDGEGKLPATVGEFTRAGTQIKIDARTLESFVTKTSDGLLKRAQDVFFLPDNDPRRAKLAKDALSVFRTSSRLEDRAAAVMILMSQRNTDHPDEKLGDATTGISIKDAWQVLKSASVSGKPDTRLAAGDFMLRTSRSATTDLTGQQDILAKVEAQLKAKPDDADLKTKLEQAKARVEATKNFQELTKYDNPTFAGLCLEVFNDPRSSKQTKLDAMVSPNSPRLGLLLEQMKHHIEPAIAREQDQGKKFAALAFIYGRDSYAIESMLRKFVGNAQEDPDLRAMASRLLTAADAPRPTVNGIPLAAGVEFKIGTTGPIKIAGEGLGADHARIRLNHDGRLMIRDMGSPSGTIIKRADGKDEKLTGEYTEINPDDKVIVGGKEKGSELILGIESLQQLVLAAADARTLTTTGALAQDNAKRIAGQLARNTEADPKFPINDRIEGRTIKLRAGEAALALGPSGMSMAPDAFKKTVATALAEVIQAENPEISKRALELLTPELLASLDVTKIETLRQTCLKTLASGKRDTASEALKLAILERSGDLFAGAIPEQRSRLFNICECVLMPGAQAELVSKDKNFNYPTYGSSKQEFKAKAIEVLAYLDPDRGADVAKVLLLGGEDRGQQVQRETASVRLAAVKALSEVSPPDLQAIALKGMRIDTDPRVLAELAKVEYGSRRPDLDPVKLDAEVREIQRRLGERAKQGSLQEGKEIFEQYRRNNQNDDYLAVSRLCEDAQGASLYKSGGVYGPDAVKARKALLWLLAEGMQSRDLSDSTKEKMCEVFPNVVQSARTDNERLKTIAAELVPGLELALQNTLRMSPTEKKILAETYSAIASRDNGIVSKEEAAVVLSELLRREMSNVSRNPYDNAKDADRSLRLQNVLLDSLKSLKSEKSIPILLSLKGGEDTTTFDSFGRITSTQHGPTTRQFKYEPGESGQLASFTETPPGKTYTKVGTSKDFTAADGSTVQKVEMVSKSTRYPEARIGREWGTFNNFQTSLLESGEAGDFKYTKDGINYLVKPTGTILAEELKSDSRKITITYADKTTRIFDFEKAGNVMKATVTNPGGKIDVWEKPYLEAAHPEWRSKNGYKQVKDLDNNNIMQPFDFTKGNYFYLQDGKTILADGYGAEYETGADHRTTTIKRGSLPPDAHPEPAVRLSAAFVLASMRQSTDLPRKAAEDEIGYIISKQKQDPGFTSEFGPKISTESLADSMAKSLANSNTDARSVVTALYKGFLSKPLDGENDPRLVVLRAALKDGNDLVRVAAAKMLAISTAPGAFESSIFALADLQKNSAYPGIKQEAASFLNEAQKTRKQLVERALSETPDKQRQPKPQEGLDFDLAAGRDVRFQRAFEQVRAMLLEGQQQYLSWHSKDWGHFCQTKGAYGLLSEGGFEEEGRREVAQYDQNRGSLSKLFDTKEATKKAHDECRASVEPKMWKQFDALIRDAMEKPDTDPEGQAARKALIYIVASHAEGMKDRPGVKEEAVKRATDAILRICQGSSPGRGDFEGPLVAILTQGSLPREQRTKLLTALDALGGKDGKVQDETIASTAALALEREFRGMQRPGQPGYEDSVNYQKKLLEVIQKYGNRDLGPALDFIAQNHSSKDVQDLAKRINGEIGQRADRGSQRVVDAMLADTASNRKFSSITEPSDGRIPLLVSAMQNGKLTEEQRLRAATILLASTNKGVSLEQRQAAGRVYTDLGLQSQVEATRFDVAATILDHTKTQFTTQQQEKAALAMGRLTFASDKTTAEKALAASQQLSAAEARESVSGILQTIDALRTSKTAINSQQLASALDSVAKLYESSDRSTANQLQLIQALKHAGDLLGSDYATTKKLLELFKGDYEKTS